MRLDLALVYLIKRAWYRLAQFFIHWYIHSYIISRRFFPKFIAVFIYIIWAAIPFYLVLRIFYAGILP